MLITSDDKRMKYIEAMDIFSQLKRTYGYASIIYAFIRENDVWKNIKTKIYLLHRRDNPGKSWKWDYGSFIIGEEFVEAGKVIQLLEKAVNDGIIEIDESTSAELTDTKSSLDVSFDKRKARMEYSGIFFEWPSYILIVESNRDIKVYNGPLLKPGLPVYPYVSYAISDVMRYKYISDRVHPSINLIMPIYDARIKSISLLSRRCFEVEVECKELGLEDLMCGYYFIDEDGISHAEKPKNIRENTFKIEADVNVSSIWIFLMSKDGRVIDQEYIDVSYPKIKPGVEYKITEEIVRGMILRGEHETIEFKQKIGKSEEFVETVVAFANTKGGYILMGVDDNGNIVGFQWEEKSRIENIIRDRCEPPIKDISFKKVKVEGKPILVIKVPEGKDKPYLVKGRGVFVRSGGSDRIATRYELDEFYRRKKGEGYSELQLF